MQSFVTTRFRNFKSRSQLERFQQRKLKQHLQWVKVHSSYYDSVDMSKFSEIPVMNRELFMKHFDELNTVGAKKADAFQIALGAEESRNFEPRLNNITVGLSSGTSGNRGLFLASDSERYDWAGTILAKLLPEVVTQKQRVALFLRSNSNLYTSVRSNRIEFQYFDLDSDVVEQITKLNRFQPTVLVSPPSRLRYLAEHADLVDFQPRKIFAGAERLELIDKLIIEKVFETDIKQIYQATEGFIAIACEQGKLHFNEDIFIVEKEYVDKSSGRYIPILTDFRRKSQPVIRYRLNDLLREVQCECGSVHQALEVEGREDDVFEFNDLTGNLKKVFPDELRSCIEALLPQGLEHYELKQLSSNRISVRLNPLNEAMKSSFELTFKNFCNQKEVVLPNMIYDVYNFESNSVKLRRVIRAIHPND